VKLYKIYAPRTNLECIGIRSPVLVQSLWSGRVKSHMKKTFTDPLLELRVLVGQNQDHTENKEDDEGNEQVFDFHGCIIVVQG